MLSNKQAELTVANAGKKSPGSAPPALVRQETLTIAERLHRARIAANKTQQQLAGDTYSKSYISAIERGRMTPSVQALGILAERLGVPMSYFLGEREVELGALTETQGALRSGSSHERQIREAAAEVQLSQVEGLIRLQQPDEALRLLQAPGEPPEDVPLMMRPRWYWLAGWALMQKHWFPEALPVLEKGLHLADTLRTQAPAIQKPLLAEMQERLRHFMGVCYDELNQAEMALDHHLQSLAAMQDGIVTDPELRLHIYTSLTQDILALGRSQDAIAFYDEASELANEMDDPRQQGRAFWEVAQAQKAQNDLAAANSTFQKAVAVFEGLETLQIVAQLRALFGQILIRLQQFDEAENALRVGLEIAERTGDQCTRGIVLEAFAELYLAKGDLDQVIQTARAGLGVVKAAGDRRTEGHLYVTLASVYAARQETAETEQAYQSALQVFAQTPDRESLGRAHEQYGQFLAELGRFQDAYEQMRLARAVLMRRTGDV